MGAWRYYNHDNRGNVIDDGVQTFVYDFFRKGAAIGRAEELADQNVEYIPERKSMVSLLRRLIEATKADQTTSSN